MKYQTKEFTIEHQATDVKTYQDLFNEIQDYEESSKYTIKYKEILKRVRGYGVSKYIVLFEINL